MTLPYATATSGQTVLQLVQDKQLLALAKD